MTIPNDDAQPASLAVLPSGKFIVTGFYDGDNSGQLIAQFNANGSLDTGFAPTSSVPGVAMTDNTLYYDTSAMAVESNGTIVVAHSDDIGSGNETTINAYGGGNTGGDHALTYDNNGNTLTDASGDSYTYDAWNHLTGVKDATGASIANYTVNALGQRITQAYPSTVSNLYYDARGQIIEVQNSSGTTQQTVYSPFYVNDVVERQAWSTLANEDSVAAFLGSYHIHVDIDCKDGGKGALLHFTVTNTTGWASGTRFRKAPGGGGEHQGIIQDRQRGSPGIQLGGNMNEVWQWDENSD